MSAPQNPGAGQAATTTVLPLTPERWPDLETIFGAKGCSTARGCWCMAYRQSGAGEPPPVGTTRAAANRAALKRLLDSGEPPGLIAFRDGNPVGWISLGPRERFPRLARSPIMKPVDDHPVWSIVCFVVPTAHRGQGVARALLRAAIDHAREHGVELLEAYPVDRRDRSRDDAMWFGARSMYANMGFKEVARRKPHRPVMRLAIG